MRSTLPKVLHQVGGKPMLQHVIETAQKLTPKRVHVVTGYDSNLVRETLLTALGEPVIDIRWTLQEQQLGTGHAVAQAIPDIDPTSTCLILYGDSPLVDAGSLKELCSSGADLSLMTAKPHNSDGLGRILRDSGGRITGIVEHKDATYDQRLVTEVNTGIMACKASSLKRWLDNLDNCNSQGEYYLTDIVATAVAEDAIVHAELAVDPTRLMGVNSLPELAIAERAFQKLNADQLMLDGVTLLDPARLDVRGNTTFGVDCVLDVNVILEGNVVVGDNVSIGPNCLIRNAVIGNNCRVNANTIIEDATLGACCEIGPYARLRPEAILKDNVKIGNFVEVKKSELGVGTKVNHLAYVGDSSVGSEVNIGAGVITCNYDGANKSQTIIGDNVFVGSDTQLIAPIRIGDGVTIGAGSTITRDVEAGMLAISRPPQKSIANWQRPKKK